MKNVFISEGKLKPRRKTKKKSEKIRKKLFEITSINQNGPKFELAQNVSYEISDIRCCKFRRTHAICNKERIEIVIACSAATCCSIAHCMRTHLWFIRSIESSNSQVNGTSWKWKLELVTWILQLNNSIFTFYSVWLSFCFALTRLGSVYNDGDNDGGTDGSDVLCPPPLSFGLRASFSVRYCSSCLFLRNFQLLLFHRFFFFIGSVC